MVINGGKIFLPRLRLIIHGRTLCVKLGAINGLIFRRARDLFSNDDRDMLYVKVDELGVGWVDVCWVASSLLCARMINMFFFRGRVKGLYI